MTTTNIPTSGVLRRIGVDVDVVVGRFDQIDKQVRFIVHIYFSLQLIFFYYCQGPPCVRTVR